MSSLPSNQPHARLHSVNRTHHVANARRQAHARWALSVVQGDHGDSAATRALLLPRVAVAARCASSGRQRTIPSVVTAAPPGGPRRLPGAGGVAGQRRRAGVGRAPVSASSSGSSSSSSSSSSWGGSQGVPERPPLTAAQRSQLSLDFGGPRARLWRFVLLKLALGPVLWLLMLVVEALKFVIGPFVYLRRKDRRDLALPDPAPGLEHISVEANGIRFAGVRAVGGKSSSSSSSSSSNSSSGSGASSSGGSGGHGGGGSRPPLVLLLHGFPDTWACWRNQLPALAAQGYEAVAINMRGYAPSDVPRGKDAYRLDVLADDVAGVIAALGRRSATVVGHDWGGIVAYAAALHRPEAVDRLVAVCAPYPGMWASAGWGQALRSYYVLMMQCALLPELSLLYNDCAAIDVMLTHPRSPYAPQRAGMVGPDDIERIKRSLTHPGGATGMIDYYRAVFDAITLRPLPPDFNPNPDRRLPMPALVLWAEKDAALGPRLNKGMGDLFDDLELVTLKGCGHWAPWERPEEVNKLLLEWLTRHPVASAPAPTPAPAQQQVG